MKNLREVDCCARCEHCETVSWTAGDADRIDYYCGHILYKNHPLEENPRDTKVSDFHICDLFQARVDPKTQGE